MNKSKRETGYYWVKAYGTWLICYYSSRYNKWRHEDDWMSDSCFEEIDEKRIEREGAV